MFILFILKPESALTHVHPALLLLDHVMKQMERLRKTAYNLIVTITHVLIPILPSWEKFVEIMLYCMMMSVYSAQLYSYQLLA